MKKVQNAYQENTYPSTQMSAGSLISIQSSISRSSGGTFPPTFQVPMHILLIKQDKKKGFSDKRYNNQTPFSHQNSATSLRFMCESNKGEALHLISFVFMYCALKVSDFRLLNLGRPSEPKNRDKRMTMQRVKKKGAIHLTL